MHVFTGQKSISAIKRQTYTGDKSAYASVGTGTGYLRPLNEAQSSVNNVQYGLGFSLILESGVDIREADILTIDSVDYTVQGIVDHDRGAARYRRCILIKPERS